MNEALPSSLRLPIEFQAADLRDEVARIEPEAWAPHDNERDYGGDWRGVALRSLSGLAKDLRAHPAEPGEFLDTPLLDQLPSFRAVISSFQCPLKNVRLLSLYPRSVVREHSDPGLGIAEGEVRIHIPVQTSRVVEFCVDGERLLLEEGSAYYIDAARPHRVRNRGTEPRIHLVIDARVNPWLGAMLRSGRPVERIPLSPGGIEAFRRHVFFNPGLQEELHAMPSPSELHSCAARLGRLYDFDISEEYPAPALSKLDEPPNGDWIPVAVRFRNSKPFVEWMHAGTRRLSEPFFDDSVRIIRRNPFARAFRCEAPLGLPADTAAPAGFIFHTSRCGSTLAAQMFAALPRLAVISEAPAIDDVIQAGRVHLQVDVKEQAAWLRSIVAALGRRRGNETAYIVKLDSWHIHDLPLIRAAFPETPWVFLFRDPVEVLVSQMRSPGRFALPGAIDTAVLRLHRDTLRLPAGEWAARVLAGYFEAAILHHGDPGGLFVNYRELPDAVWSRICPHFSLSPDEEELKLMRSAAQVDGKSPRQLFQPDSARKLEEATPLVRGLAERIMEPFRELQRLI